MGKVLNISPSRPFLETLCAFMADGGADVADDLVLLPTRRACRALREVFADAMGGAAVLPEIRPLGDVDEDGFAFLDYDVPGAGTTGLPPAISPVERELVLARLIRQKSPDMGGATAFALAGDLARLIDMVDMEELDFSRLASLVPERYSEYWRQTIEFLGIITEFYPEVLKERGCMDPVGRRVELIRRQIGEWARRPPKGRVFAAGSTGSMKPIARMLCAIAKMERGFVILPGLDRHMSDEDFENVAQSHPQYGLKNLLSRMGLLRSDVAELAGKDEIRPGFLAARERLAGLVMLGGNAMSDWHGTTLPPDVMEGASVMELGNSSGEARAVSAAIRDAVEKGLKTLLITPDRRLAKSVSAELRRWGMVVDDSAGIPASETELGNYMLLALRAVLEDFAPYPLLSLLHHSFTRLGYDWEELGRMSVELERDALRGVENVAAGRPLLDCVMEKSACFRRYMDGAEHPLYELLCAHIGMVEAFASDGAGSYARIYAGGMNADAADVLRGLVSDLSRLGGDGAGIDLMDADSYMEFITWRLFGASVRQTAAVVQPVAIMNSMEARLLSADFYIMAGLNERTFPRLASDDPWMGRPMKEDFGLPLPERKIGLSSHDFVEFFAKPRVLMTRAKKVDGTNALPSRWLSKLDAVLEIARIERDFEYEDYIMSVLAGLGAPAPVGRVSRPEPRPPKEARPRELWATQVEKWYRDPYIIYASKILGLRKLDDVGAEATAADFGNVVHRSLDEFHAKGMSSEGELLSLMLRHAAPFMGIDAMDFWMARFREIARWFAMWEEAGRGHIARTYTEAVGSLGITDDFSVRAKADRIDVMEDGTMVVSDYKTGLVPTRHEVFEGFSPQLPIEALILGNGGFEGIPAGRVSKIQYVGLGALKVDSYGDGLPELASMTLEKLRATAEKFADPSTPYLSRPNPAKVGAAIEEYSEYAHLARVKEWSA